MTVLALSIVAPAIAGAQGSRVSGDEIIAVGPDGQPRVRLGFNQFGGGQAQIFAVDGTVRVGLDTGGMGSPGGAGVNVRNPDGAVVVARLGTSVLGSTDAALPHLLLRDSSNNTRLLAILDEDGNPSIQLLDAAGKVLWSAP